MKLAAGYIVFDGLELLEASIRSIRPQVDLIIVSYQTISWRGTRSTENLANILTSLKNKGLIDEILEFTDFNPSPGITQAQILNIKEREKAKRQECLDLAKKMGCTHYMSMDADEFYRESELAAAKARIEKHNLDATAVKYINYVTPTLHRGYARWLVPFIYRITDACAHHFRQPIFAGVDPTRGVFDALYRSRHVFDPKEISMHHMELVRKDLVSKYESSSRYFPKMEKLKILGKDVETARETGWIKFSHLHLGDYDDPRTPRQLVSCDNEFGINL